MTKLIFTIFWLLAVNSLSAYEAVSFASCEIPVSSQISGKIHDIHVKEGQRVTAGEKLLTLKDEELQLQLQQLNIEIQDDSNIRLAELEVEKCRLLLNKIVEAGDAASKSERTQASFMLSKAEVTLKKHKLHRDKLIARKQIMLHKISQMCLRSPIAGIVERKACQNGENIEGLKPLMLLINTEKLHFDIHLELNKAAKLKKGDAITVIFPDKSEGKAFFIFKSSQVEAASGTRLVRFELINKNHRPAGEKVIIKFDNVGAR